ncbi:MAG: hypothetical protein ACLU98_04650 [Desulfovibrio fairfieldensis]
MSARIAVSLRGQMRALASQGIFATDCYAQMRAILLQKLGLEHGPAGWNPARRGRP